MSIETLPLVELANILLRSLERDGASLNDVITWNGTRWAPGSSTIITNPFNIQDDTNSMPDLPANTTSGNLYKKPADDNLYWATLNSGEINLSASASTTFLDTQFRIQNAIDTTKQFAISATNIPTATTLTLITANKDMYPVSLVNSTSIAVSSINYSFSGVRNTLYGISSGSSLTTGTNNILLGYNANVNTGTDSNAIVLGANTTGNGSNTLTIGTNYIANATSANILYYNSATGLISYGTAPISPTTFLDSTFRIQNSVDTTKQLAYSLTNISTATTRTITVPDNDIYLSAIVNSTSLSTGNLSYTYTGIRNTIYGIDAGTTLTTGTDNILLGYNAELAANTNISSLVIGSNTTGNGSNTTTIGTSYVSNATAANVLYYNSTTGLVSYGVSSGLPYPTTFLDSTFRVQNSTTATKQLAFDVSNVSAATTRTMTILNNPMYPNALVNSTSLAAGNLSYTFSGVSTTIHGIDAGTTLSTGTNCTAIGYQAMNLNSAGSNIVAVGYKSLSKSLGSNSVSIGSSAMLNATTGENCIAIGLSALAANIASNDDVAIGVQALLVCTGSSNIGLGNFSGFASSSGNNNIYIGHASGSTNATGSNNVVIGAFANVSAAASTNQIAIGQGVSTTADNQIRIGNASTTNTFIRGIRGATTGVANGITVLVDSNGQLGTVSSSQRYKENIQSMNNITDVLYQLNPVYFTRKSDSTHKIEYGLIAEEVAEIFNDIVVYEEIDGKSVPETIQYHILPSLILNMVINLKKSNDIEFKTLTTENINRASDLESLNVNLSQSITTLQQSDSSQTQIIASQQQAITNLQVSVATLQQTINTLQVQLDTLQSSFNLYKLTHL